MRRNVFFLISSLGLALAAPAHAAEADTAAPADGNRYDACVAMTESDAEEAFEEAIAWRDLGGSSPAEHCAAMALLAMGYSEEAAARLDALARKPESGTEEQRAELLLQAGDAWLLARRGDIAEQTFSAALTLTPRSADAWAARARARAMQEDWAQSLSDLNSAITYNNDKPEFFVLRSAAHEALGHETLARRDIETALDLDPNSPDALAERGMMRAAEGDKDGAREDWIKVLIGAPESAAADVARLGIERLEIRIEP